MSIHYASVPRGALLELDIEGPDGTPAFVLRREEIAVREAGYLREVGAELGIEHSEAAHRLLVAALAHTPTSPNYGKLGSRHEYLREYLEDGLERRVTDVELDALLEVDAEIGELIDDFADVDTSGSPTAHPIVALPGIALSGLRSTAQVREALTGYRDVVREVAAGARAGTLAWEYMASLEDYGNNYDLMAATTVPLDEPFLLKFSERRDVRVERRGWVEQDVVTADASSNHVVLFTTDPSVEIKVARANVPATKTAAYGAFTTRSSTQTFAIYGHSDDRDFRARFRARLASSARIQRTVWTATSLLVVLAIAIALHPPLTLSNYALIVGPTSLAASVLLFREPSTLGTRLRRLSLSALTVALGVLLVVSAVSYVASNYRDGVVWYPSTPSPTITKPTLGKAG
jgi:hypothetical protein